MAMRVRAQTLLPGRGDRLGLGDDAYWRHTAILLLSTLVEHITRALRTTTATTGHAQTLAQIAHTARAFAVGVANLAVGHCVTNTNVHGYLRQLVKRECE